MSEKRSFKVLLVIFKGQPLDGIVAKIFARLAREDKVEFTFVYMEMMTDLLRLAKEKFDLIIIDLDPGMVNELEGFYDALSPVEQLKVIGFGEGLPRDNGDRFPPNRIWNSASVHEEWMRKIREILTRGGQGT